jgi:hypothetical protein
MKKKMKKAIKVNRSTTPRYSLLESIELIKSKRYANIIYKKSKENGFLK